MGQCWQRGWSSFQRQLWILPSEQLCRCQSSISRLEQEDNNPVVYLAPKSKGHRQFRGLDLTVKTIWFFCSRTVRNSSTTGSRWNRSKRAPWHSACDAQSHYLPTMVSSSHLFPAGSGLEGEHPSVPLLHSRSLAGEHWGFARRYRTWWRKFHQSNVD